MRLLRILLTVGIILAVIFICLQWVYPVVGSFNVARKVRPATRVVPTDLRDQSISQNAGTKLSYFGYEFEVPWSDLDENQTELYSKGKHFKDGVVLIFRSGLRVWITSVPPHEWVNLFHKEMHTSPQAFEAFFGKSDYNFVKTVYESTPDKMNHWAWSQRTHIREEMLLILKSVVLMKSAETGIFNVHNQSLKGFQQGDPKARLDGPIVNIYSDEGSIQIVFLQKDYNNPTGVTQPEINRIIQTLQRVPQDGPAVSSAPKM